MKQRAKGQKEKARKKERRKTKAQYLTVLSEQKQRSTGQELNSGRRSCCQTPYYSHRSYSRSDSRSHRSDRYHLRFLLRPRSRCPSPPSPAPSPPLRAPLHSP
jgi:hypothetical protein